jgi:hypothetical protein
MNTNFPEQLDLFPTPDTGNQQYEEYVLKLQTQYALESVAIQAIESKIGIDGSDDPTSLDYKVAGLISGELGPQLHVRVGQFTCPANTGTYSVAGLGFQPKSVKFWVSKGPGLQTHFCECQGMMDDAGNQNSMTWAGVWSNIFKGDSRTDLVMYTINSSGSSQVTASYVSMDSGGFTVNFTVVNTAFIVRWEAIG